MQTQDYANFTLYPTEVKQQEHASLRKAMHYSDNMARETTSGQLKDCAIILSSLHFSFKRMHIHRNWYAIQFWKKPDLLLMTNTAKRSQAGQGDTAK